MHKYIIYFLLIQLNQFIFAQSAIETVNLNWGTIVEEPALKSRFNISKRYLYLESAFYDDYTTLIPKYVHSFKSIASNSTIKIESFEAIPLTADENFIYKDYSFNTIPELKILKGYENKNQIITVELIPIINDNGVLKKITLIQFNLIPEGIPKSLLKASKTYKASSILSSGDWYKARVSNDGIYKLSYDELLAQGIINPADIRVYGFGGIQQEIFINQEFDDLPEIPIYMDKGIDNVFNSGDYILMYLKGPNNWNYDVVRQEFQHSNNVYSAYSYYYFTTSLGAGNKISDAAIINATETISTLAFNDYVFRDSDEVTLINSGNQMFEKISHKSSVDYSFLISDILKDSTAYFTARTLARSSNTASNFYFMENGQSIMTSSISKLNPGYIYANSNTNSAFFKPFSETNLAINIRFSNNDASATGWIDYFYINFMRNLNLSSSQLFFRYKRGIGTGNICKYTLSNANQNTLIWDISHPHSIKNINYSLSGNNATFKYPADSIKEFVAINKSSTFSKPEFLGKIANQNLHGETQPDYVIVSHERFLSQAEELAEFHRQHSGFKVLVIEATKIYNEFSSGKPEAIAIRNMMKMFYERAGGSGNYPKYLLLFGDGSYDNKNTTDNSNFIPTFETANSVDETNSFVSDDFFGLLDDNESVYNGGVLDVGIGRFPCQLESDAQMLVNKVKHYKSSASLGDWRNNISFIADDEDNNLHINQADELAKKVELIYPTMNVVKIYLDSYKQVSSSVGERYPEANRLFNTKINTGLLILNYTGHGGESGLAHERLLSLSDIGTWYNYNKLSLLFTASCEVTRFDNKNRITAGEFMILNPNGGAVALMSTTRLVYASSNFEFNKKFYNYVFEKNSNGEYYKMGDLVRLSKNAYNIANSRNFSLIGDPALSLNYADEKIILTTINGKDITSNLDTIKALSKVTITGEITDASGALRTTFNGTIYPCIFDKPQLVKTLSNNTASPTTTFSSQHNIIYRGKVSVNAGKFELSFIVPKDISYAVGNGKASLYAHDGVKDYAGSNKSIIIGGSSDSTTSDILGPEIEVFLNDLQFVNGGITDQNPKLIVTLFDSNGINTVGNGIGHDITMNLNQSNNNIVLNDYYEAELNSYQKGKVTYDLGELPEGQHNIKLKAWDVYNNMSEKSLSFVVANTKNLEISHILNYPNPFTTYTEFHFEHNQPNIPLEILIQIFTVSGKLVKTIQTNLTTTGYKSNPIPWNGLDDFGDPIGRGVYMYKLKVRTPDGKYAEKLEKLVILR